WLKPPKVPPAASVAGGATIGPRLLPGTYTVKMTKDKDVFTTQLRVLPDPRETHTLADRQAQLDLSLKLVAMLSDMTYAVDGMNAARAALEDRAGKLPPSDPPPTNLRSASRSLDGLRTKSVAPTPAAII